MTSLLKTWAKNRVDSVLRDLCCRLLERRLFKALDVTGLDPTVAGPAWERVKAVVSQYHAEVDFYLLKDAPRSVMFDILYSEDPSEPTKNVYVRTASGRDEIASEILSGVRALRDRRNVSRYYVPEAAREEAEAVMRDGA